MIERLKKWWLKRTGKWWEDYNTHTTGGMRTVVAICPHCDSPRMKRGGWENPYYRCTECGPHAKHSTWSVDTYEEDEYREKFLRS